MFKGQQGSDGTGFEEVDKDGRRDGGSLLHLVLEEALESADDLTKRTIRSWGMAGKIQPPMKRAYCGQVHGDALGSLETTYGVQPDGVEAQHFTSDGELLEIYQTGKFLEGFGLGRQGAAGARSPGIGNHQLHVIAEKRHHT